MIALSIAGCAKSSEGFTPGGGEEPELDSLPSWDPDAARPPVTDADAEPFEAPVFTPLPPAIDTAFPEPDRVEDPLGTLRVQIFPHTGRYSTPQGKETVFSEVTFSAEPAGAGKVCNVYQVTGMTPGQSEPQHGERPIRSAARITVRLSELRTELWIACDSATAMLVREAGLKSYRYKGGFHVRQYVNELGKPSVQVVNVITFNDYLRGVVAAEMPASWNAQALRAQAVAARTYAYNSVLKAREEAATAEAKGRAVDFVEMDDTVFYQAYTGETGSHPNTDVAIEATIGQLLLYRNQPIIAYFSADSGGHTEDASNVWLVDAPYCRAKPEIFDQVLVPKPWKVSYSQAALNQRLVKSGLIDAATPVQSLRILPGDRNPSGRATIIRATLSNGTEKRIDALLFQRSMSLKSTLLTVQKTLVEEGSPEAAAPDFAEGESRATFVFDGRGFGHGAGMSQWGAKALADSLKWNYEQILHFYYTDVTLCTLVRTDATQSLPLCSN